MSRPWRDWRWFFYSPWRLLATLLVTVLLITVLTNLPSGPPQGTGGPPPPAATTAASSDPTPTAEESISRSPSTALPALETATRFVAAWAGHQATQSSWLAAMSPYTTSALIEQMSSTGPDAVPATRVTGPAVSADTANVGLAVAVVPTDAGRVSVKLEELGGVWFVDDIEPGAQAGG